MEVHPKHKEDLLKLMRRCLRSAEKKYDAEDFPELLKRTAKRLEKYEAHPNRLQLIKVSYHLLEEAEFLTHIKKAPATRQKKLIQTITLLTKYIESDNTLVAYSVNRK